MNTTQPITQFWAVTVNQLDPSGVQLYKIDLKEGVPTITVLKFKGPSILEANQSWNDGTLIGISKVAALFTPERGVRDMVTAGPFSWGYTTDQIVGLFLEFKQANECFASRNVQPVDDRFRGQTIITLRAIAKDNPWITISTVDLSFCLIDPRKW